MRSSARLLLDLWANDLGAELPPAPEREQPIGVALRAIDIAGAAAALAGLGWAAGELQLSAAADLCLLAEAINWAAKVADPLLYAAKADAVAAARAAGAVGGWGADEAGAPVYYLWTPETGETSYHDPWGEIRSALQPAARAETWPCGWSGVERQHLAADLLASRAGDGRLLAEVAAASSVHVASLFAAVDLP